MTRSRSGVYYPRTMSKTVQPETHPLVRYGERRGWKGRETAGHFVIKHSTFKQLVSGHTKASFQRASEWEKKSAGEILAIDVMRWQERNDKRSGREAA